MALDFEQGTVTSQRMLVSFTEAALRGEHRRRIRPSSQNPANSASQAADYTNQTQASADAAQQSAQQAAASADKAQNAAAAAQARRAEIDERRQEYIDKRHNRPDITEQSLLPNPKILSALALARWVLLQHRSQEARVQ